MNTVIFDVDGTLVESYEFDSIFYCQAVTKVLGNVTVHSDWSQYSHVTDVGILRQILYENSIIDNQSIYENVRAEFLKLTLSHVGKNTCRAVPGASEAIIQLMTNSNVQIGMATGGWKCTALAKLHSAGIDIRDIAFSSSDDGYDRIEIMKICFSKMKYKSKNVTYVGDGIWDLAASKSIGWNFIGIGKRLKGLHSPWIENFLDQNWHKIL